MKNHFLSFIIIAAISFACGQKSDEHEHHDGEEEIAEEGGNQALSDEVDKIHNEAMAKMDKLYFRKGKLMDTLANTSGLSEEKKKEIEDAIAKLDLAGKDMMDWMHAYKPFADSVHGEERAREYLETEMEKIRKVREGMAEAIQGSKMK